MTKQSITNLKLQAIARSPERREQAARDKSEKARNDAMHRAQQKLTASQPEWLAPSEDDGDN